MLVVIRIWRFVRIGHGIAEITNEMAHKEYDGLLDYSEQLEDLLKANNIDLPLDHSVKKESGRLSTLIENMEHYEDRGNQARAGIVEESAK